MVPVAGKAESSFLQLVLGRFLSLPSAEPLLLFGFVGLLVTKTQGFKSPVPTDPNQLRVT